MNNRLPRSFIDNLLQRIDIVEMIDTRVTLRKKGTNYMACCPFHQEKTPSFSVHPEKQFYHCFGCGVSGNAISFLMEYEGATFMEAIETLAGLAGVEIPVDKTTHVPESAVSQDLYTLLEQASRYFQQQLRKHPEADQAKNYLKQRGLTGLVAKEFGIGFAPAGWDNLLTHFQQSTALLAAGLIIKKDEGGYYDRFRLRIMFPIRDRRGRVIGFGGRVLDDSTPKYLNSPETEVFHKGSELYGLYEARKANRKLERVIIVEGYMDVIALAQFGITNAVATLGTATTTQHLQQLFRYTSEIIFCFDGDRAGREAAVRALEISLAAIQENKQVKFLFLAEDDDPDTLVRRIGVTDFLQQVEQALPLSEFFFQHLEQQADHSSLQGQAQLINLAVQSLNKMPETLLKNMLISEVAKKCRHDEKKLRGMLKKVDSVDSLKLTPKKQSSSSPSLMRVAIALLLQHPSLASLIHDDEALASLELPGSALLNRLLEIIRAEPTLNTAALIEYWRDQPELPQLMKLAAWEHVIPAVGIEVEFQATIQRLITSAREQHIQRLLNKAQLSSLSEEERQRLAILIKTR